MAPRWPQRVETMKEMIATVPEAGTNTVLITHFPNIKAALGIQINFGDAAIVKPDGHGGETAASKPVESPNPSVETGAPPAK